ncbi:MAG: tripartite tricarboxylate transporter substrate binding protein [Pseudolabrys sp.]|nr:tripartite tricarboxylate transporter substrate binding protein [Pseudolabrys sp.]
MTTRRIFLKSTLAAGMAAALPLPAFAADWPKRPVKLIVPFAAGGNTDGIARLIGQHLSAKLGETFVVENRLGAGGIIAASMVAKSAADGYTLLMAALPQIAILPVIEKVDYDAVKDFTPISNVASNPFCLVAHPDFEPKTLQDFVAYVKARPGKLSYASGGSGSLSHLTMVLFLQRAGLDMVHVPYKGGAPAIADVMGNHVPVYFGNLSEALPQAGKGLRALAVSGEKRASKLSDVPTIAESGFPGFRSETWNGIIAPAGTPQAIVDVVAAEVRVALKDQTTLQRLDTYGVDPIGSTPAEFAQTIAADIAQWSAAIKAANIKL